MKFGIYSSIANPPKGEDLPRCVDEVIEEVKSPFNGIVGRCTLLPIVASGGRFCNVAENNDGEQWQNRKVPELEKQIRFSGEPRVHN